ncbi:hypothetical protein AB4Y38_39800 [Paraburkholderia sp. EG285A]|uniref:hypothetical protein n=1 Tax=Paraburkholderia sp. EG285A TaxID=3237009 RepID=UPI0034D304E2
MRSALIVDGAYLAAAANEADPLATLGKMVHAVRRQSTGPFSRCIYFDIGADTGAPFSTPLAAALHPLDSTDLQFELRVLSVAASAGGTDLAGEAHQLLVAEMAVSAISCVLFEGVERLVIAAGDAALEPSMAMLRGRGLREFWHVAQWGSCSPTLRAHADRTFWIDELQ